MPPWVGRIYKSFSASGVFIIYIIDIQQTPHSQRSIIITGRKYIIMIRSAGKMCDRTSPAFTFVHYLR